MIPKHTPKYLRKALERALKEYDVGVKHENQLFRILYTNTQLKENQELQHLIILKMQLLS